MVPEHARDAPGSPGLVTPNFALATAALLLLVLFARAGIMGEVRKRWLPWLP